MYIYIYVCVCLYVGVLCDVVDLISGSCGVHVCYWVLRFKH